jgi:hypothetical protein
MTVLKYLLGGAAGLGALAAVAAQAQTIWIGSGPAASITTLISGTGVLTANGSNFTTTAFDTGNDLSSLSGTASIFSGSATIWVSETNIDLGPTPPPGYAYPLTFTSGFTQNSLPAGATVTETTYVNVNNAKYGTTQELGSYVFSAGGYVTQNYGPLLTNGPISLTEVYDITSPTQNPALLSTIYIQTTIGSPRPVPELSTWAMLFTGLAGLGYAGSRRGRGSKARLIA